jgi:phosphatidate cytidylyltransferase
MNAHLKRWLTSVIIVPLLIVIISYGPEILFAALITFLIVGGMVEYNHMIFDKSQILEKSEGLIAAILFPLAAYLGNSHFLLSMITLFVLAFFLIFPVKVKKQTFDVTSVMKVVFGFLYIPLMMSYFILIRNMDGGVTWIYFILVLAFAGDTVAFYIGRKFGKKKLLPFISPGKSVEGTIGLIAGSTLACILFQYFFLKEINIVHAIILGFIGSVIGQLGDLCESALKRASGLKDSGTILPGHGGILDRLDCLLFITPFVYYYKLFIIR